MPNWWMMQDNENLSVDPKGRVEGNGRDGGSTGARQDVCHQRRVRHLDSSSGEFARAWVDE